MALKIYSVLPASIIISIVITLNLSSFVYAQSDLSLDTLEDHPESIPELFIYDDETANATLPSGKTIDEFAIRHEFAKVNIDAFDSDTILFNLFGESIIVNKHSVVNSVWQGTTSDPNYVNVSVSIHDGKISGHIRHESSYFTITSFGQNDLYFIQEIDTSQFPQDEPDNWRENLQNNSLNYGGLTGNYFTFLLIFIVLIIGFTIFVIYYKNKAKKAMSN